MIKDAKKAKALYDRERQLKSLGLFLEEYNCWKDAQGGVCAICKKPPSYRSLHVDHCHTTGINRGLLCYSCNIGLGHFKDDPILLNNAIKYLGGDCHN